LYPGLTYVPKILISIQVLFGFTRLLLSAYDS
jgi:hypothetical protein